MNIKLLIRLRNGLSANAYNQLITIAVQLIGVPVFLHAWGVDLYGEWLILFAIPVYFSMADLGLSQSAGNDMTARIARGDISGALYVFKSLGVFVYWIVTIGLILSVLIFWHMPLEIWFSFTMMSDKEAKYVLLLLVAEIFFQLPDNVSHAGFRASGEYALHIVLRSTARLLQFGAMWIVVLNNGGPLTAAIVFCGARLLTTPVFAMILIYRHRWLSFGFEGARAGELRRLIRPALANIIIQLAQALNIQGMLLVVGAILGSSAVVIFSTLRTLTRLALQTAQAVSLTAEPEIARAYGADKNYLLKLLFLHTLSLGFWLALVVAIGLAFLGSFILDVWTNSKIEMDFILFACLLGSAVINIFWYSPITLLKAANAHMCAATAFMLVSASTIVISMLLFAWTGSLFSTGLALLLMDIVMIIYMLRLVAQRLGVEVSSILVQALNPYSLVNILVLYLRNTNK